MSNEVRKIEDKNIVFFGGGHMAESMIRGLLHNDRIAAERIAVHEMRQERCEYLEKTYGVTAKTDAFHYIRKADMVLVGVNPPQVPTVTAELKPVLSAGTIVLSFACGVEIKLFEDELGADKKIARIVPNTLSLSGNGYSAVHTNKNLNEEEKEFVYNLVGGLGKVMYLEEDKFNAFQAYGCTGPLWIYKFAEAMIDAGIYLGFTREQAREQLIENMLGTAKELQISGKSPTAKIEELTSPGGVTIEAIRSIQENGSYQKPTIASMADALKKCSAVGKE